MPERGITLYSEAGALTFRPASRCAPVAAVIDPDGIPFEFVGDRVEICPIKGGAITPEGLLLAAREGWWGLRVQFERPEVLAAAGGRSKPRRGRKAEEEEATP